MSEFLAPGFRFFPTEEELVEFYLKSKLEGKREELDRVIPVLDIYSHLDPWQLQSLSGEACRGDPEQWFFFSPRQERETQGGRPNRVTPSGYWKATGSPSFIYMSDNRIIGMRKTMVFYRGRAPKGTKTKWKLNEYKAFEEPLSFGATPKLRREFSVCRVYVNSGCLRSFDRRPLPSETNVHASHSRLEKDSFCINATNIEERATRTSSSEENLPISNTQNNMYKDIEDLLFSLDWE